MRKGYTILVTMFTIILTCFLSPSKGYASVTNSNITITDNVFTNPLVDMKCTIEYPNGIDTYLGNSIKVRVKLWRQPTQNQKSLVGYRKLLRKASFDSSLNVIDDPSEKGPFIEANAYELVTWEYEELISSQELPGEYAIELHRPGIGGGYLCGPQSFHVYEKPFPTLNPTKTSEQCPICPNNYYWNTTWTSCCQTGEAKCTTIKQPTYQTCPSGSTCFYGTGCGSSPHNIVTQDPNLENLKKICSSLPGSETDMNTEQGKCSACVSGEYHKGIIGSYTAIGCIPTDLATFLKKYIFGVGLGMAGGIAFLLILWGGFTIIISQGDPQKIGQGKEIIVSATVGLLFIIFAIVILNIVGKDILQLPFLGG